MTEKTPIYIWRKDIIIRDAGEYPTTSRVVTPAENAANVLANLPGCDVDALLEILVQAARYSVEIGEDNQQMKTRMEVDYLQLTSERKRTFG